MNNALQDDTLKAGETQDGDTLRATLAAILFTRPDSTYIVGRFAVASEPFPVVATGDMFAPTVGESYILTGTWVQHPKYGRQFKWTSYENVMPATEDGVERYLGSGLIRGIGPAIARRIVRAFGAGAIDVMNTDIARLREVEGIGAKTLASIRESWERQRGVQRVMLFLKAAGVGTGHAAAIVGAYGADAVQRVRNEPYGLIADVDGIGFATADRIARSLGTQPNDAGRLQAGVQFVLREAARGAGHSFLPFEQCVHSAAAVLEADADAVRSAVNTLTRERLLHADGDAVYLPALWQAERSVASSLARLFAQEPLFLDHLTLDALLRETERRFAIEYSPHQTEAIHKALAGPVTIITGGPGTGKTTAVSGMIELARALGTRVALCAPTGRAAKRLSELSGCEAKTIHRLLEFEPGAGVFQRNEEQPLDIELLIVDEVSMIDVELMDALLRAVPGAARVVFVGDVDQLPSVGPGNVLRDMIASGQIETVSLHVIYRQAEDSRIVSNAHRVRTGFAPVFGQDCFFIEEEQPEGIARTIRDVVVQRIPREMHFDARTQIQVLSPMHGTVAGVQHLNEMLQKDLNPAGRLIAQRGDRAWHVGDKVMQTRNNYDKDVFNGDMGFIDSVDNDEGVALLRFDDRVVRYAIDELDDVTLAYAVTIHKSQGSEYDVVVIPLTLQHRVMLQRNLLYTAMTRARRLLVLIGQRAALSHAVQNDRIALRYSGLRDAIRAFLR
ncbi:MAG: ATP-dependent RecD-like DNA helicase [Ignavibacteria bacterium]|nr:ATP-dependent RecD-like DNA helicase [Ignavibacteria bacterium]